MHVGLHEAIHSVGLEPSTMNLVAQPAAALWGAVGRLRDFFESFSCFALQSQDSAPPD